MIDRTFDTDEFDDLDQTIEKKTGEISGAIPYLVVLAGDSVGRVVQLDRGLNIRAGRMRDCELCFDCENVSRHHATFQVNALGMTTVSDNGSTNGTLVNGKKISTAMLQDGDRICLGDIIMRYSYQDNMEFDLQQDLYNRATRDPLTNAFNKRYFLEVFGKEFAFHKRQKLPLSVIIIDLDDFKRLNDTYGHANGDVVLKSLTNEIMSCLRREDIFARFGGEEFVGLFRCTPRTVAITIANKIIDLVTSMKFSTPNLDFNTSATVGLSTLEETNYENPEDMLIAADKNLYIGKGQGKNTVIG